MATNTIDPIDILSHAANYCYYEKWIAHYAGDHDDAESKNQAESIIIATLSRVIDARYDFSPATE